MFRRIHRGDPIADINSTGIENRTALHCAVYENRVEAAKMLLKSGASPDARTVHHRTPLHVACILGEDDMVKLLLASGSTNSAQDYEKNTPVHYAAYYSKLKLLTIRKHEDTEDVVREKT